MFDFFKSRRGEEVEQIDFVPTVHIHSESPLFVECTPTDPNSTSNIIINCYKSKTDRTAIKTRIQWSRFKFIASSKHEVEDLPFISGNAYRCEPGDLGSYIRAKITVPALLPSALMSTRLAPQKSPSAPSRSTRLPKN